ncbi:hypothetical protein RDV64_17685 [Acuticoccus sp. MNP-M23]|uniref:hypothetical protein n=1 Tax=Acuticoccus sp. MNP-M23 TaxID=3072793 RepID=UPI0028157344|nr:hypothetical protein [Acuticoccus sp. MNP-M23]WMS41881.1 hypothetical protein RDV64_17685 [Acuticoccus sp. MNP-M23]
MNLSMFNNKVLQADGNWQSHAGIYASHYDAAFEKYKSTLLAQSRSDAAAQKKKEALISLILTICTSSALIYFAGQTSLKAAATSRVMNRLAPEKKILVAQRSFDAKTKLLTWTGAQQEHGRPAKIGEFLLGSAYGEVSKHVSGGLNKLAASPNSFGPSSASPSDSVRTSVSMLGLLMHHLGRMKAMLAEAAGAAVEKMGEENAGPLLDSIAQSAYFRRPPPIQAGLAKRIELGMWMSHVLDQDYLHTLSEFNAREEGWIKQKETYQSINRSPASLGYPNSAPSVTHTAPHFRTTTTRVVKDTGDTIDQAVESAHNAVFPSDGPFFEHRKTFFGGNEIKALDRTGLVKAEFVLAKLATLG